MPPQRHSSGERPAVRRVSSDDPSLPQQSSVKEIRRMPIRNDAEQLSGKGAKPWTVRRERRREKGENPRPGTLVQQLDDDSHSDARKC